MKYLAVLTIIAFAGLLFLSCDFLTKKSNLKKFYTSGKSFIVVKTADYQAQRSDFIEIIFHEMKTIVRVGISYAQDDNYLEDTVEIKDSKYSYDKVITIAHALNFTDKPVAVENSDSDKIPKMVDFEGTTRFYMNGKQVFINKEDEKSNGYLALLRILEECLIKNKLYGESRICR